ncbi:MAG: M1 family metallopeptidase [Fluviicola sp.]
MKKFAFIYFILQSVIVFSQNNEKYNLRGGYFEHRNNWDLAQYDLSVEFDFVNKSIHGTNKISFKLTSSFDTILQIDLQDPMVFDSVLSNGKKLTFKRDVSDKNVYFVSLNYTINDVTVYFHGSPKVAKKAPWDGGIIWTKDQNGNPWTTIACQGLGASVWFPCKDSQFDEPNKVTMNYTVPSSLQCISNGRLNHQVRKGDKTTWTWEVNNPINNYCMIPYIGKYTKVEKTFKGLKGDLDYSYYVIEGNEAKAEKQFGDIERTLKAFEYWFGPYPFYEDGYKLVEAPHLGMEHQSAIAYGNGFENGYLGSDLSGTGEGLKFDFIIVHESGHEWFGNNITSKDVADMWIHESFTCYSETLFLEYFYGKEVADRYCQGIRKNIRNDIPIIGEYWMHEEGSGDMYYKGANMLHTIRTMVNNDSLFRETLRKMNAVFYHKTVTTKEIEDFMSRELKMDLSKIFDQYLRTTQVPIVNVNCTKKGIKIKVDNCVLGFKLSYNYSGKKINLSEEELFIPIEEMMVFHQDPNLYVKYSVKKTKGYNRKLKKNYCELKVEKKLN